MSDNPLTYPLVHEHQPLFDIASGFMEEYKMEVPTGEPNEAGEIIVNLYVKTSVRRNTIYVERSHSYTSTIKINALPLFFNYRTAHDFTENLKIKFRKRMRIIRDLVAQDFDAAEEAKEKREEEEAGTG